LTSLPGVQKGDGKMDSVCGWFIVTAAVFYFIGVIFRQCAMELEERHAESERAWREIGK
jgi:uncharacterized membrane protein